MRVRGSPVCERLAPMRTGPDFDRRAVRRYNQRARTGVGGTLDRQTSDDRTETCEVFHADQEAVDAARRAMPPEPTVQALAEIFKALGDPTRVRILHALSERELCVCDLASLLDMTPSAVSHQLRLLRHLRLAKPRKAGRMVYYSLDDQHVVDLFRRGLEHARHADRG